MSEWKETTLAEIAEIEMGQSPTGETCNASGDGMPLLNGPTEFGIKNPIAVQYTTDSKRECRPFDILFCVRGSTTGKMNWADRKYSIGRGLAAIRHKSGVEYRYFLQGIIDYNLELLLSSATGSTFPNVTRSQIEGVEIKLPSLPVQKSIASILSSLDDKIDLLHRQNATLEKIAETLFRQWFVEEAKEEWETGKLADEFDFTMGASPPGESYNEEGIGIPMYQGNADFGFRFPTNRVFTTDPKRLAEKHDTLISVRAPVGEQNMANEKCCIGRGVAAFRYKLDNSFYTYTFFKIKSLMDEIKQFNETGTVFGSISKSDFENIEIVIPDKISIQKFQNEAKPIDDKIITNTIQIRTLTALRDTLLPKLMSGEVKVEMYEDIQRTSRIPAKTA